MSNPVTPVTLIIKMTMIIMRKDLLALLMLTLTMMILMRKDYPGGPTPAAAVTE